MKAIITAGVSGSGKTTFANEICAEENYVNINRDDTRWGITGKLGWNGPNAYKFSSFTEKMVTSFNAKLIADAWLKGLDIIISDTNLNPVFRNKLIDNLNGVGYEVIIKEFPISFQEACRRDKERGVFAVGEAVLEKQWEGWVSYHAAKGEGVWESQSEA